jgi:hypothetical protein
VVNGVLGLLSTATVVAIVGVTAVGLLVSDLIRREPGGRRLVARRYRGVGAAMTLAFVALATLRFFRLGA